jgi:hypothetical protein
MRFQVALLWESRVDLAEENWHLRAISESDDPVAIIALALSSRRWLT